MVLDDFPTNDTADRMLSMISPIYDDSYVGKWIFEVLGKVFGDATQIIHDIELEAFPNTSTEMLPYWEEMYGINPKPGSNTEERRREIVYKRNIRKAMNPERIKSLLSETCGVESEIYENTGPYTYDVYIYTGTLSTPLLDSKWNAILDADGNPIWMFEEPQTISYDDIQRVINESKQANKHVNIVFVSDSNLELSI